ncbi:MAG: type I DNA topoisomerase, partial [Muribaculaceae bacterium]|nr:type I DNA topoisomerase [Muribaculaceae bacterium]
KEDVVAALRKAASEAQTVWLASDEDREGEAIAWHLAEVLGLDIATTRRIVFHEITKKAILKALENPRTIDLNRVDAQQARRVLDRIVGFEVSPVLWRKVMPSLSAGRVQSVAVRLIVEREREIAAFVSEPYFRVNTTFATPDGDTFRGEYSHRLPSEQDARKLLTDCGAAQFTVTDIATKPLRKSPAPPFTTSTLQQEAARKLGFSVSQTMMLAQKLYEAGHITYMRTDSLNLSDDAVKAISDEIANTMGASYLNLRQYHTQSKGAQEAHEAIRPTDVTVTTPADCNDRERRLYTLIRQRAIASQMADAEFEKTTAEITSPNAPERFTATGEVVIFDGFLKVYAEGRDEEGEAPAGMTILPHLAVGMPLTVSEMTATERFTQQPPRYTEASLVKKMEELGIGRPSTYAPTISTIQNREYIERGENEGASRPYTVLHL